MYTGCIANLANESFSQEIGQELALAATCKYAFRKFLLFEYLLILIIPNYVV